jgi:hypothetical protein
MQMVVNPEDWQQANMDCPFYPDEDLIDEIRAKEGAHPDDILGVPGIRVKACLEGSRWKYFGRLVKYKGNALKWGDKIIEYEVIVLNTQDQRTVWLGTVEQYEQMWCVD